MTQCKDIPDKPILEFLREQDGWSTWGEGHSMPTVRDAMPDGAPPKLQLAKMRMLMRRGLVDGCDCGCRGDFDLTDKGLAQYQRSCQQSRARPDRRIDSSVQQLAGSKAHEKRTL